MVKKILHTYIYRSIFLLLFSYSSYSYSQSLNISQKIQIPQGYYNVNTLVSILNTKYQINFSYSEETISGITITIKKSSEITIKEFLEKYFTPQNIEYKIIGNSIVLFPTKRLKQYIISGYIKDAISSEDIIGATVYIKNLSVGTVTNAYGFYSLKLPEGKYNIVFKSLGYKINDTIIELNSDLIINKKLKQEIYNVKEVKILSIQDSTRFLESVLMHKIKIDKVFLQELPGLFGENDALRNLSILPGVQTNEMSTSNISVRGGSPDQTIFLMDGANLYNASHFGGFFSIINPDVVNNVNIYKSDIPVNEGGALSSLIDVQLREGNNKQWQVKGGIGIISARISVEGPIVKNKSSILLAYRRTYIDNVSRLFITDNDLKNINFYFYDANLKWNYKLNNNNRFFLSGYSGSDSFIQYSHTYRTNALISARWNHIFNSQLFSNTTLNISKNIMKQGNQDGNELLYWQSEINNLKFKYDFTYYYSEAFKCSFGYSGAFYNISPFSLLTKTEKTITTRYQSSIDQMLLHSIYYSQQYLIKNKIGIDAGFRATYMETAPFSDSVIGIYDFYWEPQLRISYMFDKRRTVKASFNQQIQPLHQLPVNSSGITINRWMPANESFLPQISRNFTFGYYDNNIMGINLSAELYYRKMNNLIETMQDERILNTDDLESYLHHSEGKSYGFDLLLTYKNKKIKGTLSYDYSKALWQSDNLNMGQYYSASHTREHSFNISGVYYINKYISVSANWIFASGIPFTAANGKYQINGKTYLQFDDSKVNTNKLTPYHRLDLSLDVIGKKNNIRRWKNFWNFSIYNAYFRKNPLGVFYFIPEHNNDNKPIQTLNPGFFYLYQFVPSISYRFEF